MPERVEPWPTWDNNDHNRQSLSLKINVSIDLVWWGAPDDRWVDYVHRVQSTRPSVLGLQMDGSYG